mmetsp:Transcript_14599/g.43612  ORF Transcript_14599/g.43612 Transcript_14599/m.43612 type:complete len:244 (-) Transcript_14599:503-1234(-)
MGSRVSERDRKHNRIARSALSCPREQPIPAVPPWRHPLSVRPAAARCARARAARTVRQPCHPGCRDAKRSRRADPQRLAGLCVLSGKGRPAPPRRGPEGALPAGGERRGRALARAASGSQRPRSAPFPMRRRAARHQGRSSQNAAAGAVGSAPPPPWQPKPLGSCWPPPPSPRANGCGARRRGAPRASSPWSPHRPLPATVATPRWLRRRHRSPGSPRASSGRRARARAAPAAPPPARPEARR